MSLETEFGIHIAEGGASPVHLRTLNTLATLILWPNVEREKVHVAPQAGANGGGVVLQGAF